MANVAGALWMESFVAFVPASGERKRLAMINYSHSEKLNYHQLSLLVEF